MESFTRINVAIKEKSAAQREPAFLHFFRVDINRHPEYCGRQIAALRQRFPVKDGFEITVTYWQCAGTEYRV